MATVYLATDLRLERRVALKVMHGHLSDDTNFKNRFIQEARSAAGLADPNVVSVFDQGQDGDIAYLVMEYLPGITLRELLRDHGKLSARQVIDIMDAVTSGLAAAHRNGIVHRDVKPENVLLADDGRIKISDFGLARAVTTQTGSGQALLGTIAYLSPELVTRGIADARSDIYALGIMIYEMLTGVQPYQGEQPMQIAYQHANESVPRPSARVATVPADLDDLVLWSTERDPEERPRDAGELLDRLREVEQQLGLAAHPPTTAAAATTPLLPALFGDQDSELTDVLVSPTVRTGPVDPHDGTSALSVKVRRRSRRGWWAFVLVLLLTAGAGGAGWYFGAGPGAQLTVPSVVGKSFDEAVALLDAAEIPHDRAEDYSLDVPENTVITADPEAGSKVDRDVPVTLTVSLGLKPVTLGGLGGLALDDVKAMFADNNITLGTVTERYSSKTANGALMAAYVGDRDITATGQSAWGETVDVIVSAGAIPAVAGLSEAAARDALSAAGLTVAGQNRTQFSDSVDAGKVIQIDEVAAGKTLDRGATVTLLLSKGPDVVEVPNVVGEPVSKAKSTLEAAGFTVKVDSGLPVEGAIGLLGDRYTVSSMSPNGLEMVRRGATITIKANF